MWKIIFFIPFALYAISTNNVDAEVQWDSIYENTPFKVTLSVTHDSQDKIDPQSFTADDKKITPQFIKNVKISPSSTLEISIYTIEMAGFPQGLQVLPVFSVKINGTTVSSIPSGFEVKGKGQVKKEQTVVNEAPAPEKPFLKLQPIYTGTEVVYPGQRFFLGYLYTFNTSIDLSDEKLPLLEAKGFKKIGNKQIESAESKGISMMQVLQKVEALQPGNFHFPLSEIAGYTYSLDSKGKKHYSKMPLTVSLSPFEVKVLPFPEKGKPASFKGALGSYTFQDALVGRDQASVGDRIQLLLKLSSEEDLDQVLPPNLCCQPGFSGYFKQSDLPPEVTIKGNEKTFIVDLYVENPDVTSVPPIEFSFFDPTKKTYERIETAAIPLKVSSMSPEAPLAQSDSLGLEAITASDRFDFTQTNEKLSIPLALLSTLMLGALVLQTHLYKI